MLRGAPRVFVVLVVAVMSQGFTAQAQSLWVGQPGGLWQTGSNWSNNTVPNQSLLAVVNGSSLVLDAGDAQAFALMLGLSTSASMSHSGGTLQLTGLLPELGGLTLSNDSSYLLSDNALLVSGSEMIGYNGRGQMTQGGGSNNAGTLIVGKGDYSSGSYSLAGGNLTSHEAHLGDASSRGATALFEHSNGSHTISGELHLAAGVSSNGTYSLAGGELQCSRMTFGGEDSTALFRQSGGTCVVDGTVTMGIGWGARDRFHLQAGDLHTGALAIGGGPLGGASGDGEFVQDGGTHTTGTLRLQAHCALETAHYYLNDGACTVSGTTFVGYEGRFFQAGGVFATDAMFVSGNTATGCAISGGSFYANSVELSNSRLVVFDVSSGDVEVADTFRILRGTLNMSGGTMTAGELTFGWDGTRDVAVSEQARLVLTRKLNVSSMVNASTSTIYMQGASLDNTRGSDAYAGWQQTTLVFSGVSDAASTIEAAATSLDVSTCLGTVVLGDVQSIQASLVNAHDNEQASDAQEYASFMSLLIESGSSLDLAGIPLYVYGNASSLLNNYVAAGAIVDTSLDASHFLQANYDSTAGWTAVTVVPEPVTGWLLLLSGMLARRRRI